MLTIKPQDAAALIEAFERSSSQEMRIAAGDFALHLSKSATGLRAAWQIQPASPAPAVPAAAPSVEARATAPQEPPAPASPTVQPKAAVGPAPAGYVYVKAPNLGTFYRSPKPGAPAYVEIGGQISPDTEVCLIEIMKLFTPVAAGITGIVQEVLVNDGALVEFDQPLFLVRLDV